MEFSEELNNRAAAAVTKPINRPFSLICKVLTIATIKGVVSCQNCQVYQWELHPSQRK